MSEIVIRPVRPNTVVIGGGGNSSGSDVFVDQSLSATSTNAVSNKAVTTAINQKQDKQDNSLNTTAKTIVGAINELKTAVENGGGGGDIDLSGIEQDIADLQTAVGENTTAIAGKQDKITVETIRGDIIGEIYFVLKANIIYDIYALCTNNKTVVEIEFEGNTNESGQHYMMRLHFQDDATDISVTMYSAITWYGGNEPEWQAGKTYEISILDGLAMYAEFDTPTTELL